MVARCPLVPSPRWLSVSVAALVGLTAPPGSFAQTLIVGPKNGGIVVFPNTSGTASFSLTGLVVGQTYEWGWSCSGAVTSCTSAPGNPSWPSFTATAYGQDISINFSAGSPWTGRVSLTAQGGGGIDSGWYNLKLNNTGPAVSTLPTNADYRDVSKCVANCFDEVVSYATAPYYSIDSARSVHLVYRSAQAKPMATIQVDAVDTLTGTGTPTNMSIRVYNSQGASQTLETFYAWTAHPADGNVNRLAAEFDASSLTTGAYSYIVAVRSYRSDGSFFETDVPVPVLVLNEINSPFGAGWSIVGFQRVYQQSGNVAFTEGNGSIAYFSRTSVSCNAGICSIGYKSPKGDFTILVGDSAYSGGQVFCPYSPRAITGVCLHRNYPDGSSVTFDPSVGMLVSFDPSGNQTTFGYNGSNLLVAITDPTTKTDSLGYSGGKLSWIKDPAGRVDSITVNASGNLTRIKDAAG